MSVNINEKQALLIVSASGLASVVSVEKFADVVLASRVPLVGIFEVQQIDAPRRIYYHSEVDGVRQYVYADDMALAFKFNEPAAV